MPRIRAATIGEHKEITRRQILAAAQQLIAETGTANVSLGEVAAEVGIGRTTVYDYFADRDDLIASLVEETLPEVLAGLFADLPSAPADQLSAVAGRLIEFVATDPVLGLILHRELPRLSTGAQDRIRLAHRDLATQTAAIHREGVARGEFGPLPPDLAGRLIQDVVMAGAAVVLADPDPARRLPSVKAALAGFLLRGLQSGR